MPAKATAKRAPVKRASKRTPNGKPATNGHTAITEAVEAIAISSDDLAVLRGRYDLLQLQRRLTEAASESYTAFGRELAERYSLPPRFNVDFSTGLVTEAE